MKNRKRIFAIFVACVICMVSLFGVELSISASEVSGSTDDYDYVHDTDANTIALTKYKGTQTSVAVPSEIDGIPVTELRCVFYRNETVEEVVIPEGVTALKSVSFLGTFQECTNLMNVTLPESLEYIDESCFHGCVGLTDITLPESVAEISYQAFRECDSLTSVTLPDKITNIPHNLFSGCDNLTSVTLPENITRIEVCAFMNCSSLTDLSIPETVTQIGDCAFEGTAITELELPSGITQIRYKTFFNCANLKSVTIPFSVIDIGQEAFENCPDLTDIYYEGSESDWQQIKIWSNNPALENITIHYGSDVPLTPVTDETTTTTTTATTTTTTQTTAATTYNSNMLYSTTTTVPVYDDPPVIIGNSFGIRTEPIKLQYAIGEELDYTGIWVDHLMTYQYVRSTIYNDGFYNDEKFMSLFKDISEKPETIPYSDPIVWPYFYPNYYYVDATDFDNQVPGTYEIRLYGYIAATDAIYEKMDSFYVTVGDGIQTGTATSESTTTPATTTTTTAFTGTMTTTTSDSGKESCGDVDGNSVIDLVDASAVLSAYAQNAAGLTAEDYTGSQLTAADVNGDSKADLADASFILRYYARNAAGLSPTWEEILGA